MTDHQGPVVAALPSLRRRQLATLFESGTVGPIPEGKGRGTLLLGTGGLFGRSAAAAVHGLLWRGKVVDGRHGRLQNLLGPSSIPAVTAEVYEGRSWHDGKACIVIDYSRTSRVAGMIRDEMREVAPGLFLGMAFLGRVHVIDFSLAFD